ncbi:MAG: hypothetical protein NZM41_06710, partial [Saprospiraceae bacterium]|nr:hypothetical protein [Saprospiraceae bacterium]
MGREHRFFKGTLDGRVLADHPLINVNALAFFFRDNQLYVLGYIGDNYSEQMGDVGWYDHNGQLIKVFRFNPVGPTLCNGGAIDNRLYFSYIGYQNIPGGCPTPTVAIDVRDLNFNLIRRFKINECDYAYCSNIPFAKGKDGSIYFQAVHKSYEKFLVQKYTPDLQLIWSKEFKGHDDTLYVAPMQIVPTEDGGVLIKCFHLFGDSKVSLYKISA